MSKKYVYIVLGGTGEYSDREEWVVGCYLNEKSAKRHVEELSSWCVANRVAYRERNINEDRGDLVCPLDSNFRSDYTGTRYHYLTSELLDEEASDE